MKKFFQVSQMKKKNDGFAFVLSSCLHDVQAALRRLCLIISGLITDGLIIIRARLLFIIGLVHGPAESLLIRM